MENKGNPYHDEEGKFTTKEGQGSAIDDDNEQVDLGNKDDIEDNNSSDDMFADDDFEDITVDDDFDLDDLDDEFADIEVEENAVSLSEEQENEINNYNYGELETALVNSPYNDYDKEKIFNASPEELRQLLKAQLIVSQKNKLVANNNELNELNNELFPGLWLKDVSAADYKDLKSNWIKKYEYFDKQYTGEDKADKIQKLLRFKELGELYEQSYNELFSSIKEYEELLEKYSDPNSAYSQKRKDAAVWIKGVGVSEKAIKKFGPHANKLIDELKAYNPKAWQAIYFYTSSYSIINEPLRGVKYGNYNDPSPFGFVETVKKMTEAVDSSTYDFDYWCQRGTNALKINDSLTLDYYTDMKTLQSLVGQTFKHQSFYSAGAGKGTGFSSNNIIINTYCPKGTKGFYMNTQGHYAHSGENEMILQRGYSYKINKVEKHGGTIYLDVDVILGSDSEKYNDKQLQEIKNKYVSK